MAVDIPIHGEELFLVDLDKKTMLENQTTIPEVKKNLQQALHSVAFFLAYIRGLDGHKAQDCTLVKKNNFETIFQCNQMKIKQMDGELQVVVKEDGGTPFKAFFGVLDQFYKRIKWEIDSSQGALTLELFPTECLPSKVKTVR